MCPVLIVNLLILFWGMLFPGIFPMKMKIEFLEEKIKWQEKIIGELENERDFLREQVLGKAKGQDVG